MLSNEPDLKALIDQLSLAEKVDMLSGELPFHEGMHKLVKEDYYHKTPFYAARNDRLNVPGIAFIDGPRGVVIFGGATSFPVTMARGASWNPELEEKIGDAIGKELRALGGTLFGGVCINLLRHPAWGRAQETYGEDPVHLGAMGAALTRGVERHAMACVKHYAANSMENARFMVDVRMDPRTLHEVYLPHFKACIDAGASAVMSAYNSVNGEWCGQSKALLLDTLKTRWGFEGYVLTDFVFGMRDAKLAIENGLDLEMPFNMVWGPNLLRLVESGEVDESLLDGALERLIAPQLKIPSAQDYPRELVGHEDHKALAREAAVQSMTLLKNDADLLPLRRDASIAVVGTLAAKANLGDRGSSDGRPDYVVTPLDGLNGGASNPVGFVETLEGDGAQELVRSADAAIVVVGYTHRDEGEHVQPPNLEDFAALIPPPDPLRWLFANRLMAPLWTAISRGTLRKQAKRAAESSRSDNAAFGKGGDRVSLSLSNEDIALIERACALNENVVVAVMGGSAILMEEWRHLPKGIMMIWYPGMEGGHAFADILFGDRAPGGRLPFVIPKAETDLPYFDRNATSIEYDLWHGYRKLDRDEVEPAFPFGFGLSYSHFEYGDLQCGQETARADDILELNVDVTNSGSHDADEVVQVYVASADSDIERAPSELRAFKKVHVEAGQTRRVEISLPIANLAYFDEAKDDFVVENTTYEISVKRHSKDPDARSVSIAVT